VNSTLQAVRTAYPEIEPFEDRVDILFRELELAIKWQRPSILLAIYSSEYVYTDAKTSLKYKLTDIIQNVHLVQISNEENSDIPLYLSEFADLDKTVFFIEGLRWGGGKDGARAYRALSIGREFFIDRRIRAVFWLTESEANDLARYAPDFWAYRHRVVEFVEPPTPEQISLRALEATWQGIGEYADTLEDIDAKIALREAMLTNLPERDDSIAIRGELLFALGVLHWRRGDCEKASHFLHTALEIATYTHDQWFEAVCINAFALVYATLGTIDQAIESLKQAAMLAPDQIFLWNNLGNLYSQLDRNEEAISALEKALELNPIDAVSWNGLGAIYHKLGRTDEAIATYQKAVEYAPNFAYPWIGLGDVFLGIDRIEEAIDAFHKAIGINQRIVHPWIRLGNIYEKQERGEEALKAYQKAFEIDPKNVQVWNEQGNVYLNAGEYDKAIAAYLKAIELDHGSGRLYCNLAWAYSQKGSYQEAVPLYQKSIDLFGNNQDKAIAWNRLGNAYRQLGDNESAIASYQRAIELNPEDATLRQALGRIQSELDRIDETLSVDKENTATPIVAVGDDAIAIDHRAIELNEFDPNQVLFVSDPGIRRNGSGHREESGTAYDATGMDPQIDYVNAVVAYQKEAELALLDPGHAQDRAFAWIDLGELHNDAGHLGETVAMKKEEARAADQKTARFFPAQAPVGKAPQVIAQDAMPVEGVVNMGTEAAVKVQNTAIPDKNEVPVDNHANDEAIAAYQKVTEINPTNARAWHTLGNLLRTSGRYNKAVSAFQQAVSLDPNKEVFHYHLGLVYAAQKRYDEAVRAFQKVVELNPDYNLAHCTLAGYYRRLGQEDEAKKHIAIALPTMKNETEYNRACFAAICGNIDEALALLNEALEKKQTTLDWVRRDPDFEFIRDDPRFQALVEA